MFREFFAMTAAVVCAAPAFAQNLPNDPRLVTGELANGLSYIVMRHATPPTRAAVWMHVSSGSLNETEAQRGLAHFLEHMAFNGSENFPPGSVVPYFESLGLTFGRHQNAFTSFDQTTYQLSLPDNTAETLSKGLLFFSDINSRLLLGAEEIDAERGVILNEKTSRKSAQQRVSEYMLERSTPGSLYARRLPIGVDETLRTVTRQDFVDYYTKWYGPKNSTIIVVADMDPGVVVGLIAERFNTPAREGAVVPADADPGITPYTQSFGVVATDPELTRATVQFMRVDPAGPPITTEPQLRQNWVEDLAQAAFNRRMADLVSKGGTPFQNAFAASSQSGRIMRSTAALAVGTPEKWREMMSALALEMQRARAFGFTAREIDDARADALSGLEQAAKTEPTLPASAHLARINGALASGRTILSAQQRADLGRRLLPGITPEECSAWFTKAFDPSAVMIGVQLPKADSNPSEADVLSHGLAALSVEPTPPAQQTTAKSLLDALPEPGAISGETTHEASAVWSAWIADNIRMHHRFMDARKGSATISVTLYGGELLETPANRGITQAAAIALSAGGRGGGAAATKRLTSADVRSLLTGKQVNVSGRTGSDAVQITISGAPGDLETGMQLAHLLLREPRIEPAAFDRWKEAMLQMVDAMDKAPMQAFSKAEARARYPESDVRTQAFTRAQLEAVTIDKAQAHLERLIATSPIEVAVVGDISREQAAALVARYIGSLPKRERVTPGALAELRTLPAPTGPREVRMEIETITDQAGASVGFYGPDQSATDDVRAMSLASMILSTRMVKKIREQEALVYSIRCGLQPGATYPGYGMMRAGAPCRPMNADKLPASIVEVFDAFAKDGPTAEELDVARKQKANELDEGMKEPGFWLRRLESLTYDNIALDETLRDPEAYQAITTEQIKAAFNRYYRPDRTVTVVVKPKAAATPAP